MQADQEPVRIVWGLELTAWVKIALVTGLLAATFRFNLVRLWLKTNPFTGEANWRHAIFVPLFGLYYLYVNREDLLKAKVKPCWSALVFLVAGLLIFTYGIWPGQNDFVKDVGMVISIFGTVLMLTGWQVMKVAWFPIIFLFCALPWPDQVYSIVATPLQHLAASVAVGVLRLCQIEATNTGTKIIMLRPNGEWRTLNVAEACAGLRSLMTFVSVGAAVAFLSFRPFWQKVIVVASAVPIAVFCNVVRVSGQGLLDRVSEQLSEGFAHQFVGIFMLIPGFFLVLLTGWLLDRLFVEVVDRNTVRREMGPTTWRGAAVQWKLPTQPMFNRPATAPAARPQPPKTVAQSTPPRAGAVVSTTKPAQAPGGLLSMGAGQSEADGAAQTGTGANSRISVENRVSNRK